MARRINESGLNLIKQWEGCKLEAYQDVAGIWTIGYGHIKGVTPGMTITAEQAEQILRDDLASAENAVDSATTDVPTTDNQFAAMVALCFNIGSGNFRTSSVLRDHRAQDYAATAAAFGMWNKSHVDGKLQAVQGLTNRRAAESTLYLAA
jgi:lysozyme